MSDRLHTIKEAEKLFEVTTSTIQQWDRQGRIGLVRTVGTLRDRSRDENNKMESATYSSLYNSGLS